MWRRFAPALLLAGLASCGAGGGSGEQAVASLELSSSAFADGEAIPQQFTCDGANELPPLAWTGIPDGTGSFALVMDDPDAPGGTFRHWGAYNIPASSNGIPSGQGGQFPEAVNDFGKPGYGGPCPPKGHGPHHYRFKLYALDSERLELSNPKVADLEAEAQKHQIARAELVGTYERK